jgi:hypothetical protein
MRNGLNTSNGIIAMGRSCRFYTDRLFGRSYVNVIEVADIMARWEIRTDTPVEKIAIKTCWFNGGPILVANDSWLFQWVTLPSLRVHVLEQVFDS